MNTPKTLSFSQSNRPWARRREYQRFWGTYKQSRGSGLYIDSSASAANVERLNRAFAKLPPQLQALAHQWQVTFSFAEQVTAAGNNATFYADFSQCDRKLISPHIEMSRTSLREEIIVGDLSHELAHLFWRSSPFESRVAYRDFLVSNSHEDLVEVTPYVQHLYKDYRQETVRRFKLPLSLQLPWLKPEDNYSLRAWVEESFCDTVAVLVLPSHPHLQAEQDLVAMRRGAIAALMALHL